MMETSLLERLSGLGGLPTFANETPLLFLEAPLLFEDVLKASLISGVNVLLLGERGSGKTQVLSDIASAWFGGNAIHLRVRADMDLREVYTRFNLSEMHLELNGTFQSLLCLIDEVNRAPGIVQNQLFHLLDGYIEFEGRKIYLGREGYHVCLGTMNVGERYHGIFGIDPALLDRFGVVIDMESFPPGPKEKLKALKEPNARVLEAQSKNETGLILRLNQELKGFKPGLLFDMALLYIESCLGFCFPERSQGTSLKAPVLGGLPRICEGCNRLGFGCGYLKPASLRLLKTIGALVPALSLIASLKAGKPPKAPGAKEAFELFRFLAPFADVANTDYIRSHHYGNPRPFLGEVTDRLQRRFFSMEKPVKEALSSVKKGRFSGVKKASLMEPFRDEWGFFLNLLAQGAEFLDDASLEGEWT
jgi:hypothetical protein